MIDIAIIGGGAAGLATAIFTKRRLPDRSIVILDGAKKLGAKILVSGGGRCNVTNVRVTPNDFFGGSRNVVKRVLKALPVAETLAFFREIGVELHEEPNGKLFPNSNQARTVLESLIREAKRLGVEIRTECRVSKIEKENDQFAIYAESDQLVTKCVVLATGGKSLPKTGSDGFGYKLAQSLGHSLVPLTPALAPLLLDGNRHAEFSGISQDVELTLHAEGEKPVRMTGSMLWTHFGISGPVVLDISRHWHSARLENKSLTLTVSFFPGEDFTSIDRMLIDAASENPKARVKSILSRKMPERVAEMFLAEAGIQPPTMMGQLAKDSRRKLVHALVELPLKVRDSRGYGFAEVTAGGIPLSEVESSTLASRICEGLYFVGEILDVDGRIGGFNFQWAWAGGKVVADGLARDFDKD